MVISVQLLAANPQQLLVVLLWVVSKVNCQKIKYRQNYCKVWIEVSLNQVSLISLHWLHQCVIAGKPHIELISMSSIECPSKLVTTEVDGKHGMR